MTSVFAPVRLAEGTWAAVRFQPAAAEAEPYASPDGSVSIIDTRTGGADVGTHLERLKAKARELVPEAASAINDACPQVTLVAGPPGATAVLSTSRDRSWELAYVLACAAVAGRFDESWSYWATGQVDGNTIAAADLPEKLDFVLNRPGRVCLIAPITAGPDPPPDKLLVPTTTLGQLLLDAGSPLTTRVGDISRYSPVGVPPALARFADPRTFDTRRGCAEWLSEILRDEHKRLILLMGPLGWGKTTVLTRALRLARLPTLVVSLDHVMSFAGGIDAVLAGFRSRREADLEAIDANPRDFATALRRLLPGSLIVFTNGNVNDTGRLSPELQKLILTLLDEQFRCVVECWTPEDWQYAGRFARDAIEVVPATRLPRLADDEVSAWVSGQCRLNADAAAAFSVLDGHPLGINQTLASVLLDVELNVPVDRDIVLDHAITWVSRSEVDAYIQRIEALVGRNLSTDVLEWFTVFWPQALPLDATSPDERRQLLQGVRLGLLSAEPDGLRAHGWFHLFCRSRLRRLTGRRTLSFERGALRLPDAAARARQRRHIVELAAELPAYTDALVRLASQLPDPAAEDHASAFEYVAPVPAEALKRVAFGSADLELRIWALEQACRGQDASQSADRWDDLLADVAALTSALQGDWTMLRSVARSYRVASTMTPQDPQRVVRLLDVVSRIDVTAGAGHAYYAATLLLELSRDLGRAGYDRDREAALKRAASVASTLPEPRRDDHRYTPWIELQIRLLRRRYQFAGSHDEGRTLLNAAAAMIDRELSIDPDAPSWQRRYLWVLAESAAITDGVLPPVIAAGPLPSCAPSLLSSFLLDYPWIFDPPEPTASAGAPNPLAEFPRTYWRTHVPIDDQPRASDHVALMCGLLSDDSRAIARTRELLARAWGDSGAGELDWRPVEVVRLTTTYLRLAERRPSLRRHMDDGVFTRERVARVCTMVPRRDARRLWLAFVRHAAGHVLRGGADDPRRSLIRLRGLFSKCVEDMPDQAIEVLAAHYDHAQRVWQVMRRSPERVARTGAGPGDLEAIVTEMVRRAPTHPLTLRYRARYCRYTWDYAGAYQANEAALRAAGTAQRRREVLGELADLLSVHVLTPPVLRSRHSPEASPDLTCRLRQVGEELQRAHASRPELSIVAGSLDADEARWRSWLGIVYARLGTPSEFWTRVASPGNDDAPDEPWGVLMDDLTDADVMRLAARALTWGSELPELSHETRQQLITASLLCICAAARWQRNVSEARPLATDFRLACTIALALRYDGDGALFGSAYSPFLSRNRGKRQTWRQAAEARFQSVVGRAVGAFRAHALEVSGRLLAQLSA